MVCSSVIIIIIIIIIFGYGLDDRRFESRQGFGIFLFTTVSRYTLGPTPFGTGGFLPRDKAAGA
jgi:hypothetical protein